MGEKAKRKSKSKHTPYRWQVGAGIGLVGGLGITLITIAVWLIFFWGFRSAAYPRWLVFALFLCGLLSLVAPLYTTPLSAFIASGRFERWKIGMGCLIFIPFISLMVLCVVFTLPFLILLLATWMRDLL